MGWCDVVPSREIWLNSILGLSPPNKIYQKVLKRGSAQTKTGNIQEVISTVTKTIAKQNPIFGCLLRDQAILKNN